MWDYCGMERSEEGLRKAIGRIRELKHEFWSDVKVLGTGAELNQALERAGRVADFFELGELMCIDALVRRESCGGHFRVESQTEDGEALRHDDEFAYVSAWEFGGEGGKPVLHKEPLVYEYVEMKQRRLQRKSKGWTTERPPAARRRHTWRTPGTEASHEHHRAGLAAGGSLRRGQDGHLPGPRHLRAHVVPGDARRAERAADHAGRRPDRLRQRLPGGHLRRRAGW